MNHTPGPWNPTETEHGTRFIITTREGAAIAVEAVDGKYLIQADAPTIPADDLPEVTGFDSSATGATSAIVPAKIFADALKVKAQKRGIPALENVMVTLEPKRVTFATTSLETGCVTPTRAIQCTYPNVDSIFPKGKSKATLTVNARILGKLLTVIADTLKDAGEDQAGNCPVRIDIYQDGQALQFSAGREGAKCGKLSALLMPLEGQKLGKWKGNPDPVEKDNEKE